MGNENVRGTLTQMQEDALQNLKTDQKWKAKCQNKVAQFVVDNKHAPAQWFTEGPVSDATCAERVAQVKTWWRDNPLCYHAVSDQVEPCVTDASSVVLRR